MSASQYAVFHFDVKTMVMRAGEPLIFDGLSDAERYARATIAAEPAVGCRILNSEGKTVATFSDPQVHEKYHGEPAAQRSLLIGFICLVIGLAGIAIDLRFGLRLILPFFLGVRFLWVAAVRLIDGFSAPKKKAAC